MRALFDWMWRSVLPDGAGLTKGDILQGAAFMLMMLFALMADGLMDKLGEAGFMIAGLVVMGIVRVLQEAGA